MTPTSNQGRATVAIRKLEPDDAPAAARVHLDAFPGFFLSTLGEPFLQEFYTGFTADRAAVGLAAVDARGGIVGIAVGTLEPAGFFSRLLRRRLLRFTIASGRAALREPRSIKRLLRGLRYRGEAPASSGGMALLSSICVAPDVQGASVGSALIEAWTEACGMRGAESAYLTTDTHDNDLVHNFYLRHGWHPRQTHVTHEGRSMTTYVRDLQREGPHRA